MDCDELIDQLLVEKDIGQSVDPATTQVDTVAKREKLAALAAGGKATQYLGRALTPDQIDGMAGKEIEKLYARYEARLGAAVTKTLGACALQLYTSAASMFLPIPLENQPKLVADLEADPFVYHALSAATCELYHRYGMYLAPLTAALTTAKHCQFEQAPTQPIYTENDRRKSGPESDIDSTSTEEP